MKQPISLQPRLCAAEDPKLTPRQAEVLALLERGHSNAEIAALLGISLDGAKWHVTEILGRLGFQSRTEAARWSRLRAA